MISEIIEEWIKGILIDGITGNLSGLFDNVNAKVGEIAADVGCLSCSRTCIRSTRLRTLICLCYYCVKSTFSLINFRISTANSTF